MGFFKSNVLQTYHIEFFIFLLFTARPHLSKVIAVPCVAHLLETK